MRDPHVRLGGERVGEEGRRRASCMGGFCAAAIRMARSRLCCLQIRPETSGSIVAKRVRAI
jgi:hypothetical protein